MPSSYTTSLRLTLPVTGELPGQWGTTVNTGITSLVDDSIAGTTNITVGGSDYTLTNTDGQTNEARRMFITATGTPGAARNVIVPAVSKLYFVFNNTTGGFALTFKTPSGTGIAVPAGARMILYCNGTNVVDAINSITLASPLPTSSGGTGLSSFTANRVFYASSTSAIGSSANLTFNGTTLTAAAFSGPLNGTVGATTPASGAFTTLGATGNVNLNGGTFTFNDSGADLDARFEGDTDANLLFLDASTDRVGIGTNSPGYKLDVVGIGKATSSFAVGDSSGNLSGTFVNESDVSKSVTFNADPGNVGASSFMRWNVDGVERMRITSAGDVGIGTTSPGAKLDVLSADGVNGIVTTGSTVGGSVALRPDGTNGNAIRWGGSGPAASVLRFLSPGDTERMRITSAGDVGIGTASPTAGVKLQVVGAGQFLSSASNVRGLILEATGGHASNISVIRAGYADWLIGSPNNSDSLHISVTDPTHATPSMTFASAGNIIVGSAALATNATNGFFYIPGCAGTPTGTPTSYTGRVPLVVDTTNNKLYFYSGGQWRDAGP